jgi:hypothetical protein
VTILSHDWCVTIDRVWVVTRFTAHFDTTRDCIVQFTVTHKLIFPQYHVHYRRLIAAFEGGRIPFSGFLNCPWPQLPASNSISQRLNPSCSLIDCSKVKVTSRLTAYHQSLRLSCLLLSAYYQGFLELNPSGHSPYSHSPLWLEDGFVSYEEAWSFTSVRIAHIARYCKFLLFTAYKSYVSPGFAKQIVSSLLILRYKAAQSLHHLNYRKFYHNQV